MLRELNIENVAVIEKATVSFGAGLNILTGETGAGKSILIDSINAILGNRTTRDIVRSGAQKAVIWAEFSDIGSRVSRLLCEQGYEGEDVLILHREITVDGKSVCRINGRPATAQTVRDICSGLINIHGQHDNQELLNPERHIHIIDGFASLKDEVEAFGELYDRLSHIKEEMDKLTMDEAQKERRIDLLSYQIDEIEKAELVDGEEDELAARRTLIRNAERVMDAMKAAYSLLSGDGEGDNALSMLYTAMNSLGSIEGIDEELDAAAARLSEAYYSLTDVASDVGRRMDVFGFDANDLDAVEERLDVIYKLKRKYGGSIAEILQFRDTAQEELDTIESADERLGELKREYEMLLEQAEEAAERLSEKRKASFSVFVDRIKDELSYLNMQGVGFVVAHKQGKLTRLGIDQVEFFISPNIGETAKPLSRIASGGELSRIMLAIKNALADKDEIDTLIFDEIDTGVSGSAAAKIGRKLKQSAVSRQTICVTHSAQIAAFCDTHLFIDKTVRDGRTFTEITELDYEGRKRELARIISGDNVTETALHNAGEMLELASKGD